MSSSETITLQLRSETGADALRLTTRREVLGDDLNPSRGRVRNARRLTKFGHKVDRETLLLSMTNNASEVHSYSVVPSIAWRRLR